MPVASGITHRTAGSLRLYLIAGFVWTCLYVFQNILTADAFNGVNSSALHEQLHEFAYPGFTTLTTLGYGEITPVAPFAPGLYPDFPDSY